MALTPTEAIDFCIAKARTFDDFPTRIKRAKEYKEFRAAFGLPGDNPKDHPLIRIAAKVVLTEYLWECLPMMTQAMNLNLAADKLLFFVQFRHIRKWDQFRLYLGKGEAEELSRAVIEASGRLPSYIERYRADEAAFNALRGAGLQFGPEESPEDLADD